MSNNNKGTEEKFSGSHLSASNESKQRLYCCLPRGESYTEQPYNRKAAQLEARARSFKATNSWLWARWVEDVRNEAANRRRWSGSFLAETARKYDAVNDDGEPFKINNDLIPAFTRMLCEEIPEACPFVELRTSVFEKARDERHGMEAG